MTEKVKRNNEVVELATKGDALGWKEYFYGSGNEQRIYTTKSWANMDGVVKTLGWTCPEDGLYAVKFSFDTLGETGLGAFADRALQYRRFRAILRRGGSDGILATSGVNALGGQEEFSEELFFMYPLKAGDILYPQIWTDLADKKVYVRFFAAKISI